jgi:2-oxoglutarate dehydrogenase E2 component (dihydrolipoamide succinyltransferase)
VVIEMKIEIIMPKMGESITEGTIIKWHKKIGETIKKDEILFEISTDKVDAEIPSPTDGVLLELLFREGETIEVGKVVAILEVAGEGNIQKLQADLVELKKSSEFATLTAAADIAAKEDVIEITMPKMGESIMEGTILKWNKGVGEKVIRDEILFEISTDKVDTEVPSPADGYLLKILVQEQETVGVGTVVALLGNEMPTATSIDAEPNSAPEESFHQTIAEQVKTAIQSEQLADSPTGEMKPSTETAENRFYSPLVLNIAQKENVSFAELERIAGNGIGNRVTKNDILAYIKQKNSGMVSVPERNVNDKINTVVIENSLASDKQISKTEGSTVPGAVEIVPMDNIRQKVMQHMIASRDISVHVSETVEVDMSKIVAFMKQQRDNLLKQQGIKLTYTAFIAAAAVKALREFPLVNASIEGNSILLKRNINLGIAVALEPNGLIVPNIKNAQDKNIIGLAKAISELSGKARLKKLSPDDISGGTFTITNYGVFGTLHGTPIINQPELAILGAGAIVKRAVIVETEGNDSIAVKPMMYVTLSHDHRLIDGMLGGRFLRAITQYLENFDEKMFY